MMVLGINANDAEVSAVPLRDGNLVAAVEEERFRRMREGEKAGRPRNGEFRIADCEREEAGKQ